MVKLTEAQIKVLRNHALIFKRVGFNSVFVRNEKGRAISVHAGTFGRLLFLGTIELSGNNGIYETYRITDAGRAALERSEG